MKFDVCIGNPPYNSGEYQNNQPLWPNFIYSADEIANKTCMVHPGRWIIPGKLYTKVFEKMKKCGLKDFKYYPKSSDIFPSIGLDGGVSITYYEHNYTDDIHYYINDIDKGTFTLNQKVFMNQFIEEAYTKVFNNIDYENNMQCRVRGDLNTNGTHAYGYIINKDTSLIKDTDENMIEPVKVWISKTQGRGNAKFTWYFIEKSNLLDIDSYLYHSKKVAIDGRGHSLVHGKGNGFNNLPQICERNQIAFGNILVFPEVERERDLLLIKSLFMTKTARFLMSITQTGLGVCGFENVPDYIELAKLLPEDELFTDEWFYKTFDFSEGLINEIETRVSPKVDKEA